MDGEHQGLVHLAAALVWAPHPSLLHHPGRCFAGHRLDCLNRGLQVRCACGCKTLHDQALFPSLQTLPKAALRGGAVACPEPFFAEPPLEPSASHVLKEHIAGEASAAPGGPSERMDRWVIARSPQHAQQQAEARFPGQQPSLQQVRRIRYTVSLLCLLCSRIWVHGTMAAPFRQVAHSDCPAHRHIEARASSGELVKLSEYAACTAG